MTSSNEMICILDRVRVRVRVRVKIRISVRVRVRVRGRTHASPSFEDIIRSWVAPSQNRWYAICTPVGLGARARDRVGAKVRVSLRPKVRFGIGTRLTIRASVGAIRSRVGNSRCAAL